jgi:hypothetical protein
MNKKDRSKTAFYSIFGALLSSLSGVIINSDKYLPYQKDKVGIFFFCSIAFASFSFIFFICKPQKWYWGLLCIFTVVVISGIVAYLYLFLSSNSLLNNYGQFD